MIDPVDWSLRPARYRWAALLRRIFEVDPLTCPQGQGAMRIVAFLTDPAVITRILPVHTGEAGVVRAEVGGAGGEPLPPPVDSTLVEPAR